MPRPAAAVARAHRARCIFVPVGDPSPSATPAILDALVEVGSDVIELGMPFTDPMADVPAIQAATLRSLAAGTTTAGILAIARDFRARHPHIPLVLMGYANPMLRRGPDWFAAAARDAGIDGVICVDRSEEHTSELQSLMRISYAVFCLKKKTEHNDNVRLHN